MRRLLDVFSKREKTTNAPAFPDPPSPAFHVPLRHAGTSSQLSEFAPSGMSTCSSEQSSVPYPPPQVHESVPPSKSRSLRSWLHSRRGRKQISFVADPVTPSHPSSKTERTGRSRAQSDSRTKEIFGESPSEGTPSNPKEKSSRVPLLRSQSAFVKSRSKQADEEAPPTPKLPLAFEVSSRIQLQAGAASVDKFCEFTETSLEELSSPHPHIVPKTNDLEYPSSLTSFPTRQFKSTLLKTVHKQNLLRWVKSHPSDPQLETLRAHHWPNRSSPEPLPEAMLRSGAVQDRCPSLERWVIRPCYEDRYDLYFPDGDQCVESRPISGGKFAVAALEYSNLLDLLATPMPQIPLHIETTPAVVITGVIEELTSPPKSDFSDLFSLAKSEFSDLTFTPKSDLSGTDSPRTSEFSESNSTTTRPVSLAKRGVRFQAEVEEVEHDDLIPLAVARRAHLKRESKKRAIEMEEQQMLLKAQREAEKVEEVKKKEQARRKSYAAELAATRERRESTRDGYQPQKRVSMVHSTSSISVSSAENLTKSFKYDSSRSFSSGLLTETHLRPSSLKSRPASYTSSGEESFTPNQFDRGSSTSSLPQLGGGSSRSNTSSTDSLPRSRQHSRERSVHSTHTSRSRKSSTSTHNKHSVSGSQSPVPPVPFLARQWNTSELPLPHPVMMQQGPFLASLRTPQGVYLQPQINYYTTNVIPVPQPMSGYGNFSPVPQQYQQQLMQQQQSPQNTRHPSNFTRTHSANATVVKKSSQSSSSRTRRTSSYGPTRSTQPP